MANHEHAPQRELGEREIVEDLLHRVRNPGGGFWLWVIVLAVVFLAGIVGFVIRLSGGLSNTGAWGYYAAVFGFLLSTVMAAPIIPIGLHFTKAIWPRPIARAALLYTIPGILWGLMFLPLLGTQPPAEGRASIWFEAPMTVRLVATALAVIALVLVGLVYLYLRARPDWAVMRDSGRRGWLSRLAGGWEGSVRDWTLLQPTLSLIGAAYLFVYAYVTMLITTDFNLGLIPGWRSAIYPTYFIVTSLQAGVALTLVTIALLRRFGGLGDYLRLDQFWALGKIELALSLLWFYFFWSEFMVIWYGRTPREIALLQILNFGPYFLPFVLTPIFAFVVPFLLLIWNSIRKSYVGPPLAATSILIGIFFDRVRLFVPAYQIAGVGHDAAEQAPHVPAVLPTHFPDLADVLIVVGFLGGSALLYLLALRLLPPVSIWEMKVFSIYREARRFLRVTVEVVGKPD
jgi:molybdopterin-containing oxidoreductase family membrane subunit